MTARAIPDVWTTHNDAGHAVVLPAQALRLMMQPAPRGLWLPQQTTDSSTDSSSNDEARPRKAHKDTYAARREKAKALTAEVNRLTSQLSALKQRQAGPQQYVSVKRGAELARMLQENAFMRSLVHMNNLMLHFSLSGMMSDDPSINQLTSYIHLTSDAQHRRHSLVALKQQKLALTDQYVRAKNSQRDLLKPYNVISHCEDAQGNFFCSHSDIVQLRGAKNARQAYDALMFTMANMEINVSERLGEITVREDYTMLNEGVGNYRMLTWEHPTVSQEVNSVMYTQFFENRPYDELSDDDGFGITSTDFVDRDDLYPYCPSQSMRRDLTVACIISSRRDPENDQELVIVIQRIAFIKIHASALVRDPSVLKEMRDRVTSWCDVVLTSMKDYIASKQNKPVIMELGPLTAA